MLMPRHHFSFYTQMWICVWWCGIDKEQAAAAATAAMGIAAAATAKAADWLGGRHRQRDHTAKRGIDKRKPNSGSCHSFLVFLSSRALRIPRAWNWGKGKLASSFRMKLGLVGKLNSFPVDPSQEFEIKNGNHFRSSISKWFLQFHIFLLLFFRSNCFKWKFVSLGLKI